MKIKFQGSVEELKNKFNSKNWVTKENVGRVDLQAKTPKGITINFFKSTGNIQIQGNISKEEENTLNQILNIDLTTEEFKDRNNKRIFIVHGHDDMSKKELKLILREWGLIPVVSGEEPAQGKTIIENLLSHIESCMYGIILLTPDDFGYSKKDGTEQVKPRARQNVVLEMGIVLGILGRSRVIVLRKAEVEDPTDINGLIYKAYRESVDETKESLRKELISAGIYIQE